MPMVNIANMIMEILRGGGGGGEKNFVSRKKFFFLYGKF